MSGFVRYHGALLLLVLLVASTAPSPSSGAEPGQAGNATVGQVLIQKWCSQCHISDGAKIATDMAPPFTTLMNDPSYTNMRLQGWLSDPHPPMPKIGLTRQMIRDIIAHLSTFRSTPE